MAGMALKNLKIPNNEANRRDLAYPNEQREKFERTVMFIQKFSLFLWAFWQRMHNFFHAFLFQRLH